MDYVNCSLAFDPPYKILYTIDFEFCLVEFSENPKKRILLNLRENLGYGIVEIGLLDLGAKKHVFILNMLKLQDDAF